MCVCVCARLSYPDEDREERPAAVRQVDVRVEQVLMQQWVVESRQSGQNRRQLQVQLVWLKNTSDIIRTVTSSVTAEHT